jgi:predicted protein tyrosine phosphatase
VEIFVMGKLALEVLLTYPIEQNTGIISVRSHTSTALDTSKIEKESNNIKFSILYLCFDDCEENSKYEYGITKDDAENIRSFVLKCFRENYERIIVQCDAGVSRSAGVGAALMKFFNDDDMKIFENPRYCPNMRCYRTVLDAMFYSNDFEVDYCNPIGSKPTEEEIQEKLKINIDLWNKENNIDFDRMGNVVES